MVLHGVVTDDLTLSPTNQFSVMVWYPSLPELFLLTGIPTIKQEIVELRREKLKDFLMSSYIRVISQSRDDCRDSLQTVTQGSQVLYDHVSY